MASHPLPTIEYLAEQYERLKKQNEDLLDRVADLEDQLPQTQQTMAARFDRHCTLLEGLLVEHFALSSARSLVLVRLPGQARVRQAIRGDGSEADRLIVARYVLYYILQQYEPMASLPALTNRYGLSNQRYHEVLYRCEVDRTWRQLRRSVERDFLNATGRESTPISDPSPETIKAANTRRLSEARRVRLLTPAAVGVAG